MKLVTLCVEKPWGRTDLPPQFQTHGASIGEVWFDAPDRKLPLLVKWLFTSERLSIQVHPNDEQAKAQGFVSGKEECWIVTAAEPGAVLGIGTKSPLNAEALRQASLDGEIENLMDWKPVSPGDYFYIPAGTVHAIGAGITLVEVQQNADVTYRLYDYGRPRELHLDAGIAVSHALPYHDMRQGKLTMAARQQLVAGPHFDLWHGRGDAITTLVSESETCWVIPLTGCVYGNEMRAVPGECLYLAQSTSLSVTVDSSALVATV